MGKHQWARCNFKGDTGVVIFQTLENHLGKMLRVWRTGEKGCNTILVPDDSGHGWAKFLNGLMIDDDDQLRSAQLQFSPSDRVPHEGRISEYLPFHQTYQQASSYRDSWETRRTTQVLWAGNEKVVELANDRGEPMEKADDRGVPIENSRDRLRNSDWGGMREAEVSSDLKEDADPHQKDFPIFRKVRLEPVGEDRAILFCTWTVERDLVVTAEDAIGGDLVALITPWKPDLHWANCGWGGVNVRIVIQGLPLNMAKLRIHRLVRDGKKLGTIFDEHEAPAEKIRDGHCAFGAEEERNAASNSHQQHGKSGLNKTIVIGMTRDVL
ncbi:hypothetical protein Sjap_005485 [Stephania japonica]|uniref:Uncharacterized protein n=1 Tax=Stephania japonica TaxID=461633 RepID=A0AAP0PIU0_9MAGN